MEFEWDEAKRLSNVDKHGVEFVEILQFDWGTAVESEDLRQPYGEGRWRSAGLIGGVLHILIYTRRRSRIRVISLRQASRREKVRYAEDKA